MADERVPPGPDHLTPDRPPSPREGVRPAPASPAAPPETTFLQALGYEALHFAVAFALALVAFFALRATGAALASAAGFSVIALFLARGLTGYVVPDPRLRKSAAAEPPTDTLREIVETVVFVVVLVLLLKSFVAEAFVIPTGSMATTLWGYQKVVECPECGYVFPVNASDEADPQDGRPPQKVTGCTCPNCRYEIRFDDERRRHPGWEAPSWSSGDRVLVAKFLYDLLEKPPERLDVVVFKFPGDTNNQPWPQSGPFNRNYVPMNYIKRLVGESGEVIAVHAGNLYRIPADRVPDEVRQQFAEDARRDAARVADGGAPELWRLPYTHTETGDKAKKFFSDHFFTHDPQKKLFEIVRKPPETMLAMRRIVYDNDHPAKDLQGKGWERWKGEGWAEAGRGFAHPATSGSDTDWLRYHHLLRENHGKPQLITDFMGYNSAPGMGFSPQSGVNWVGELMVECDANVERADGGLTLELSHGVDRFQARFDPATGTCKLVRLGAAGEQELASEKTALSKPGNYHLRFADFDHRLTVWVDDALPFGHGVAYDPPGDEGPTKENDLERPASVGVRGAAVRVDHLQLWRDTYYTTPAGSHPGDADVPAVRDFTDPGNFEALKDLPVRTMDVQPGHYLCMGDNSPASSDGRTWGLVPQRLLLGRALVVYYPFNRAGRIR